MRGAAVVSVLHQCPTANAKPSRVPGFEAKGLHPLPRLQHRPDRHPRPRPRCARGTPHSSRAPCAPCRCAPASSPSTSAACRRAAATTSRGKLRSCTLCRSISAASASALSRSISESAKAASAAQACATIAFSSGSSASQALSDTMHSPVPFGLLKPGAVVDRRDAIEPERDVGAGADELGARRARRIAAMVRISPGGVVCGVAPSRR